MRWWLWNGSDWSNTVSILGSGNVKIGTTAVSDGAHVINNNSAQDSNKAIVTFTSNSGAATAAAVYAVSSTCGNSGNTALNVCSASGTSRSINAGGSINANGADYAEYINWTGAKPEPGTIINYRNTYMVVSSSKTAAFVGNDRFDNNSILITFMGQVHVKTMGPVSECDYIVPTYSGYGVPVSPSNIAFSDYMKSDGRAGENSTA